MFGELCRFSHVEPTAAPEPPPLPVARPVKVRPLGIAPSLARMPTTPPRCPAKAEADEACEKQRYEEMREMVRIGAAVGRASLAAEAPKEEAVPKTGPRAYWHSWLAKRQKQQEEEEAARLQAETDGAERLKKVEGAKAARQQAWQAKLDAVRVKIAARKDEEARAAAWQAKLDAAKLRIAARKEEEEATLKAAEGEAARKRRKLQPTPKWKPGSMAALIAAEGSASLKAEADEAERFADVMTADEAAAEAARLQIIDDYLEEQ